MAMSAESKEAKVDYGQERQEKQQKQCRGREPAPLFWPTACGAGRRGVESKSLSSFPVDFHDLRHYFSRIAAIGFSGHAQRRAAMRLDRSPARSLRESPRFRRAAPGQAETGHHELP